MKQDNEKSNYHGRVRTFILLVITVVCAFIVSYVASINPEWLHLSFRIKKLKDIAILLIGIAVIITLIKWPRVGVYGLIAIIVSNISEIGVRFHHWPSLLQVLTPVMMLVVLHRSFIAKQAKLVWDTLLFWLALYVTFLYFSSVWAANPLLADAVAFEQLKCLFFTVVIINCVHSEESLRGVAWVLVLTGAFLGTITVVQVVTHAYSFNFGGFGRVKHAHIVGSMHHARMSGPLSDPNYYAQILIMLLPVAIYRLWDEISVRKKFFAAYATAVMLTALVFTYSRGGALALGLILFCIFIHKKRVRYLLVGLLIGIMLLLFAPDEFKGRLNTIEQLFPNEEELTVHIDSSFQERILYMKTAGVMFNDHPLLGVGAGNYTEHYREYSNRVGSSVSSYEDFDKPRFPHSLYLQVAAETGIVGFFIFLIILSVSFFRLLSSYRLFHEKDDTMSADIVASFSVGFVGYLTTSIILHGDYIRYLWLLFALAIISYHVAQQYTHTR